VDTFGKVVRKERIDANIGLREMARYLNVAPSYLSDIENERRNPPKIEVIEKIASKLHLNLEQLSDLAGKSKDSIPPDLPGKVKEKKELVALLRTASKLSPEKIKEIKDKIEKGDF